MHFSKATIPQEDYQTSLVAWLSQPDDISEQQFHYGEDQQLRIEESFDL